MIMPLSDESVSRKRDELISLLEDISRIDPEELVSNHLYDYAYRFDEIYSDGYRQMYSELYPVIHHIRDEDPINLDILCENLECVRVFLGDSDTAERYRFRKELYGCVLKLSDHINLEIQRLHDSEEIEKKLDEMYAKAKDIGNTVEEVDLKIQKVQTELVLILSIFASIIMLFSGSISVLGNSISVLGEPHEVHELVMVLLICGFVLVNAICILMSFIRRMISDLHSDKRRIDFTGFISANAPILLLDALMIIMLSIDIIVWVY